jgi:chemotaxis signal transduction protein
MEAAMKEETVQTRKRQFCTFSISGRRYGVDILDVKEVNPEVGFTPIFHAHEEVKGYVNIRGQIYLILDLRLILGFESKKVDEASRLVLFKSDAGEAFGILVDSIGDIVTVKEEQIEDRRIEDEGLPDSVKQERRALDLGAGVCKLEDALLVIVNVSNLLNVIGNLKRHWGETLK